MECIKQLLAQCPCRSSPSAASNTWSTFVHLRGLTPSLLQALLAEVHVACIAEGMVASSPPNNSTASRSKCTISTWPSNAATLKGHASLLHPHSHSRKLSAGWSAPTASRWETALGRPNLAATYSGDCPSLVNYLIASGTSSVSILSGSGSSRAAAKCRMVQPCPSRSIRSAPASNSSRTMTVRV